jgi:hypothetical protein
MFCFGFFHESPSPKPLIITLGSFRICTGGKFAADVNNDTDSKFATGVIDTGGK